MNKLAYRGRTTEAFDSFNKILILFQITSSIRNHHQLYPLSLGRVNKDPSACIGSPQRIKDYVVTTLVSQR